MRRRLSKNRAELSYHQKELRDKALELLETIMQEQSIEYQNSAEKFNETLEDNQSDHKLRSGKKPKEDITRQKVKSGHYVIGDFIEFSDGDNIQRKTITGFGKVWVEDDNEVCYAYFDQIPA